MRAEGPEEIAENPFEGNGKISALLQSYDWSQTPLGAVETWSESLKTAVQSQLTDLTQAQRPKQVQQASVPSQNCTQTGALCESEAKYRMLFESIDQGFFICGMLFDENDEPFDYRFLEVNAAFERLTGLEQVIGKTARQLVPNLETDWFEIYGSVVCTREPVRFEQQVIAINRWFDVHAFCIGEPKSHQFAALFTNISEAKLIEAERKKVEQERDRFLAVGSDLQIITSSNGYFHWASPAFERILGWTPDEMTSRPWTDFVHPDDISKSVLESTSLFSGTETFAFENRYRHKDGSYRWLLWRAQPHLKDQVLYATTVDISERKQAEAALRQSEEHYRTLFESIDEGFCTIEVLLDADGKPFDHRILQANPAFKRQSGITNPVGKRSSELAPGLEQDWNDLYAKVIQTGESIRTEERSDTLDRWFEVLVSRVGDAAMHQVAIVFTDISDRKQAEAILQQTSDELERQVRKFDATLSTITDCVFSFDRDGRFLYVNQVLLDLWGVTAPEAIGKTMAELNYPPTVERQVLDDLQQVLETGKSVKNETLYINPTGVEGYFEYILSPVTAADHTIESVVGLSRDISDHKQTEATLRESEQRFRLMADAVPQIVWITDAQGQTEFFNKQWSKYTGVPYEPTTAADVAANFVHPEDGDRTMVAFNAAKRSGGIFAVEHRIRSATGSYRWFLVRAEPYRDLQTGEIVRWFGASVDIHDRFQAEEALRESETRLRVMLDVSQIGEWDLDLTTEPHIAHRSLRHDQIFGYESLLPEWSYEIFLAHVHPDDRAAVNEKFQETLSASTNWNFECRVIHPDQSIHWIWARSSVYCDFGATPTRLLGMVVDITDRKQVLEREQAAREEAERANRLKDEFLAVLSHELRSPLNPILGWTRLLRNGKLNPARQMDALATIERNAKLQAQLIEDLLDISRIMQGKLTLSATPVSLAFVITAAIETVRLAADAKQIQIMLDLDPNVAPVSGDAARLQQVVWNLLSNAVKFTEHGGQVTIQLRRVVAAGSLGNAMAQIRVIDTGRGISPQFLPYVFEYFRQEDGSTTRQFGGLGLGLAIVRQIVELHGGTVKAESRGEHQGATFIVQLPTLQASLVDLEPTQVQAHSEMRLQNVQILLVDDDTDTREFEAFLLEQQGATVIATASGREALQALDRSLPDVIISDIGMAEIDGYLLMQQIRSRPPTQGGTIPAIALTAYAAEIDQKKALQAGFQIHLTKPLDPEQFINAIMSLLKSNRT
jgi:PAS domain S-box-containing protein